MMMPITMSTTKASKTEQNTKKRRIGRTRGEEENDGDKTEAVSMMEREAKKAEGEEAGDDNPEEEQGSEEMVPGRFAHN